MAKAKIRWSSLLNLSELEFIPEPLKELNLSDEMILSLSIMTAATGHDRKIVRCNELGAMLVGNAWDNLEAVESDQLYINGGTPDSFVQSVTNNGVLLATVDVIIKATFVRISSGSSEDIYLAANSLYFYPHSTYSVTVDAVPTAGSISSYVGLTAFK